MADDKKIPKQKQPKEEKATKSSIKDIAESLKDVNKENFAQLNDTLIRNTSTLREIGKILQTQNVNLKSIDVNSTTQTKLDESSKRDDYQIEQKEDANFILLKEQNELLNQILNAIGKSESDIKKKENEDESNVGFMEGLIGGIFGKKFLGVAKKMFSKIAGVLSFLFVTPFKKIFGKAAVKLFAKRLLKFVIAPITALFAIIDFSEGWKDAEKITGRKGWAAKFQGGFSKVLSGLTLGLIKPKTISKGIDFLYKFLKDKVVMPVVRFVIKLPQMIIDLFKKYFNLETFYAIINKLKEIPIIADVFSKMSEAFNYLINKFQTYIINPIKSFIDLIREKIAIIGQKFYSFASDMKNVLMNPLTTVKKMINDAIGDFFGEKVGNLNTYQGMGSESLKGIFPSEENSNLRKLLDLNLGASLEKKTRKQEPSVINNNNISSFASNTTNNRIVDMSTFSDDLVNMSPIFNFS